MWPHQGRYDLGGRQLPVECPPGPVYVGGCTRKASRLGFLLPKCLPLIKAPSFTLTLEGKQLRAGSDPAQTISFRCAAWMPSIQPAQIVA